MFGVLIFVYSLSLGSSVQNGTASCPRKRNSVGPPGIALLSIRHTLRAAGTASRSSRVASDSFPSYKASFARLYRDDSEEHSLREELFLRRVQLINAHNAQQQRTWTAGLSHLTDRTDEELAQLKGWRNVARKRRGPVLLAQATRPMSALASEVDWRRLSTASSVPDQARCGSCWAQASATMLSARHEAQKNQSRTFSAQQLVDCVPNPHECGGSGGCQGSTVELAMEYVQAMGLSDASEVPYTGKDGTCNRQLPALHSSLQGGNRIGMLSWEKLPENKAEPLMRHVLEGPVAVSVAADAWWMYSSGVFDGCNKDATVNHAVVLFGYGIQEQDSLKYWTLQNSWGNSWGEDGFIRLRRGQAPEDDDNHCGTDSDPSAGVACKPYPDSVRVCGTCGILYDSVVVHFGEV